MFRRKKKYLTSFLLKMGGRTWASGHWLEPSDREAVEKYLDRLLTSANRFLIDNEGKVVEIHNINRYTGYKVPHDELIHVFTMFNSGEHGIFMRSESGLNLPELPVWQAIAKARYVILDRTILDDDAAKPKHRRV